MTCGENSGLTCGVTRGMRCPPAIHVGCAVAVLASVVAWLATGREGYTRWPDARLAGADAPPSAEESSILAEIGFADQDDPVLHADIHSRFAFGLVPGGFAPLHLLSVATVVTAAAIASGAAAAVHACRGRPAAASPSRSTPRSAHDLA